MGEKKKKYDFSLATTDERSRFIDEKLSFIFGAKPYELMGYSTADMDSERKNNRIPKLIDGYTTYYLKANDAGSSRKTEYSYYTCVRDEMRRKGNQVLYKESDSLDRQIGLDNDSLTIGDVLADDRADMRILEFGAEDIDTSTIKYALSEGRLDRGMAKIVLAHASDILFNSVDREVGEMVEQLVFNCYIQAKDTTDEGILREYTKGHSLRDIGEKLEISAPTVKRRMDKMLSWI